MRRLFLLAILSVAVAKPTPGIVSPWGHTGLSSLDLVHQPAYTVAQPLLHSSVVSQPVVHASPVVHAAPVALAKQATSYSSFQQIVHPVSVVQSVAHAPIVSQPVVHTAPLVQTVAQPLVHSAPVYQTVSQQLLHSAPLVQQVVHSAPLVHSLGEVGHGW